MSNLNDGFYDDDYQDDQFNMSWLDLILLALLTIVLVVWKWFLSMFKKAKEKIIPKASDDEYADWFENQRP